MLKHKTAFLLFASTGLRANEALGLTTSDVDFEERRVIPRSRSDTKRTWVSFYNDETEKYLERFVPERDEKNDGLLQIGKKVICRYFRKASEGSGAKISPKILRRWFASETVDR